MFTTDSLQDAQQELALIHRAQLLTDLETSVGASTAELRQMADGRRDLLASAAGSQIGTYLASPRTTDPDQLLAGTLLLLAGADTERVQDSVQTASMDVRRWKRMAAHGAA